MARTGCPPVGTAGARGSSSIDPGAWKRGARGGVRNSRGRVRARSGSSEHVPVTVTLIKTHEPSSVSAAQSPCRRGAQATVAGI